MLERIKKNLRSDLWIVLLDIIAVNGACQSALGNRYEVKAISGAKIELKQINKA